MIKANVFPTIDDKTAREEGTVFAPNFDAHGLLPVTVTSATTGEVLMFAFMNAEALALSLETGEAHYWSRSRKSLWRKGETSGNRQRIVEMRTDCDQDAIWMRVRTRGHGAACHTGHQTCFYRRIPVATAEARLEHAGTPRAFDPSDVYTRKA